MEPPVGLDGGTEWAGDRRRAVGTAEYLEKPLWVEIEPESFAAEEEAWAEHLEEHYHRALADGRDAAEAHRTAIT